MTNAYVPEPEFELRDGTPVAAGFDDVYFSRAGGVAETEHVFLRGNGLPERWAECARFTIAELGFGTGLNFLVAWKKFRETVHQDAVLHFISIEKFPFKLEQLRALLALQPEVAAEAELLLTAYPLRLPGIHRVHLPQAVLTLCFGDIEEMLPQITTPIDAWFLDGFSPAKNPAMWSETVLTQIGALSAPGSTFATFTAAGAVKRGLEAAGFAIEKIPGFSHKREMLVGKKVVSRHLSDVSKSAAPSQKSILILGAGIGGATLAWAMAERGFAVTMIERGEVASGASGNAAAVLYPQLTKRWTITAAWYFTAYGFMVRQLARWKHLDFAQQTIGMLRLPRNAEEEEQLRNVNQTLGLDPAMVHWVSRDEASERAGVKLPTGAAFFEQGTWIDPNKLCHALLQHQKIALRTQIAANNVKRAGEQWQVTLTNGEVLTADYVCVAAGNASADLLTNYGVRLNAVGGQVSEFAAADVAATLRSILCRKGYLIPHGERYLVGATYHRDSLTEVTDARHAENVAELADMLPDWFEGAVISGRSSVRATTPDRLPYVGAVDDGLYVSTGHGSRGMLSAPIAAEMIAAEIYGEMSPVSAELREAVRPLRFKRS